MFLTWSSGKTAVVHSKRTITHDLTAMRVNLLLRRSDDF